MTDHYKVHVVSEKSGVTTQDRIWCYPDLEAAQRAWDHVVNCLRMINDMSVPARGIAVARSNGTVTTITLEGQAVSA